MQRGNGLAQGAALLALLAAAPAGPLALAADAGASSGARGAPPGRAEVEARLEKAGRGPAPDLGREAGPALVQIADDRAAAATLRARAMSALAFVRTPAAHDFLEGFLVRKRPSSDPADRMLIRKAAVALGWQSGPRTVEVLAALLDHADAEVRLDVVVALGLTRARAAERPLRARLTDESDPAVRAQIEKQLKVVAPAAAPP